MAADNSALIAARDALVTELQARWPTMTADMADLLNRVSDMDRRTRAAGVASVESLARGVTDVGLGSCTGGMGDYAHVVRLSRTVLPVLAASSNPYAPVTVWPSH